jgi:hypothetical protein
MKEDKEFLPTSVKEWIPQRPGNSLKNPARLIHSMNGILGWDFSGIVETGLRTP